MATLENWSTILYNCMATVGKGQQPIRGANQYLAIFFIAFIVFCSFFILNLIIGVSIDKV